MTGAADLLPLDTMAWWVVERQQAMQGPRSALARCLRRKGSARRDRGRERAGRLARPPPGLELAVSLQRGRAVSSWDSSRRCACAWESAAARALNQISSSGRVGGARQGQVNPRGRSNSGHLEVPRLLSPNPAPQSSSPEEPHKKGECLVTHDLGTETGANLQVVTCMCPKI